MPAAGDDTRDDDGYRPVSVLAIAALAGGAASAVALVGPVFWVLPLVGVGLAIAALADVARPGAPKAGRLAALAGLGLALGFGAQAVATTATAEWLARSRAEAAARFWLDAIAAGRIDDARGMCAAEAADAVDRLAAAGVSLRPRTRGRGRDEESGGRVVRVTAGDRDFDLVLRLTPPRQAAEPERFSVVRCDPVTPTGN